MRTVLYLDDSVIALRLLEHVMRDAARLICASTIPEAMRFMDEEDIDCFVLDYMLTDGNGIEFAKRIRAIDRYANTPIVLVSAGLTTDMAYRAMRIGINQCVDKPFNATRFREVLASQLEHPTVHIVDRSHIHVCCATWEADGAYYEYSPDTGTLIRDDTRTGAHAKMRKLLTEFVDSKLGDEADDCALVLELETVRHTIEASGQSSADRTPSSAQVIL